MTEQQRARIKALQVAIDAIDFASDELHLEDDNDDFKYLVQMDLSRIEAIFRKQLHKVKSGGAQ